MNEMVERVARALCRSEFFTCICELRRRNPEMDCRDKLRLARAAIAAMRDPTDAMVDAANEADQNTHAGYTHLWAAMIDAALGEG